MRSAKKLVIFDVDGTLVDSQADILSAMRHAFARADVPAPSDDAILGIVGLSLDVAVARLAPDQPVSRQAQMVDWYKEAYVGLRAQVGAAQSSPLYPMALETLEGLSTRPDVVLGVATGKSQRGLDKLMEGHALRHFFTTMQVSDHHPSKPHPSMLMSALKETGVAARDAVMIGDTSFDMEMARAAGVCGIGVAWGYHARSALGAARHVIEDFRQLGPLLSDLWGDAP